MVGEKVYTNKNSLVQKYTRLPLFSFAAILNSQPFKTSFMLSVDGNEVTSNSLGKNPGSIKHTTVILSQIEQQQGIAKTHYKADKEARVQLLCNHCCKTRWTKGSSACCRTSFANEKMGIRKLFPLTTIQGVFRKEK